MRKFLVCIIVLVLALTGCKESKVSCENVIYADDSSLYYTSENGYLCKYSFLDKYVEKITDKFYLKAYNDKYFIGYTDNTIKVYNRYSKRISEIKNINLNCIDILNDTIYYSNNDDNNYIYTIDIDSMEKVIFLEVSTNKFSVNKNYIFYEQSMNSIYSYNLKSKIKEKVFDGRYCFFFYCDDENIYLSDYLNNNTISKINISTKKYENICDVSTLDFYINNDKLYYIPMVDENVYNKKREYHVYRFNLHNNASELLI